jgi:hypothetical protein
MSTSAVVLFALFALSLTPAADASCTGTKRNKNQFCAAATCTATECCEYMPNTCYSYKNQLPSSSLVGVYACQALTHTYNSANDATVLALGTTVAQFQAACCTTVTGTCAAWVGANCPTATHYANTANSASTTQTLANCCTEYPKCATASYTCSAGYTAQNPTFYVGGTAAASPGGTAGKSTSGTDSTCCTPTAGTCAAWVTTVGNCPTATHYANTANAASTTQTAANCCTEYPKCTAYTCDAGYTAQNPTFYVGGTAAASPGGTAGKSTSGTDPKCCTVTANTCTAYRNQVVSPYSCPTGYRNTNAGSTIAAASICASTFLSTCCTGQTTCVGYNCPTAQRVKSTPCGNTLPGVNACSDAQCCIAQYNTCESPATAALTACSTGTYVSTATAGTTAPCTQAEFQSTCCVSYPTCSTYSCPSGYTATSAVASTACTGGACTPTQCCTAITGACAFHTCDPLTGQQHNPSAANTVGATDAICCTARPLCSAYTCTSGITTGKNAVTYGNSDAECCTADTTKCYGSILGCPSGYYSIAGNAGASNAGLSAVGQDTFNTNCCALKELCNTYWYATGTSSSAVALRPALVTVVIGAIAGLLM